MDCGFVRFFVATTTTTVGQFSAMACELSATRLTPQALTCPHVLRVLVRDLEFVRGGGHTQQPRSTGSAGGRVSAKHATAVSAPLHRTQSCATRARLLLHPASGDWPAPPRRRCGVSVRRGRQGDSGEGRPAWSPTGSVPDRFLNRGGDGRVSLHCSHC